MYLDTAHKIASRPTDMQNAVHSDDKRTGKYEKPMARVRRAVCGMPYAGDAGIVSKPAEGLATIMAVILASKQQASRFGQDHGRQCCWKHGTLRPGLHRSSSKQQDKGINRQCSFYTSAALSTRTLTSWLRSIDGSDS